MPNEKTRADSLRLYLTGADADGSAQADPAASLGAYRSATEVISLGYTASNLPANITVDHVAGANGPGVGTLAFDGTSGVQWTPPDSYQGAAVTITNGQTKIAEGADDDGTPDYARYVRLSRTSASALVGTATLTLTERYNHGVGLADLTPAEALAGADHYRCLCLKNWNTYEIQNLKLAVRALGDAVVSSAQQLGASGAGELEGTAGAFSGWLDSGFARICEDDGSDTLREIVYYENRTADVLTVPATGRGLLGSSAGAGAADDLLYPVPGIRLALEAPTGGDDDGSAQTIASATTEPSGRTWSTAIDCDDGSALDVGALGSGELEYLWEHRHTPAGMNATPELLNVIQWQFDGV